MSKTLGQRQCEFTHNLGLLIIYAANCGLHIKIQEVNRTMEQQKHNVATGVSWTLDSKHLENLAADIYIYDLEKSAPVEDETQYLILGKYWEELKGRWGGRFKPIKENGIGIDPYHFEWNAT